MVNPYANIRKALAMDTSRRTGVDGNWGVE